MDPGLRALLRLDVAGRHPQQPPAPPAALGDPPVEIASALGETWNDTFGTLQKWAPIYGYLQYVYIYNIYIYMYVYIGIYIRYTWVSTLIYIYIDEGLTEH